MLSMLSMPPVFKLISTWGGGYSANPPPKLEADSMNNRLFTAAERYIRAGLAPIPVWPDKRKNPRLSSITEYRERLPEAIEWARWAAAYPNSNIALITGFWGLCALDFDTIGDYNAWWMGVKPAYRETWIVETGRGRHVYFMDSDAGADRLFCQGHNEVLLRAKGAYTIAPPSIHHTGREYRTVINKKPAHVPVDKMLHGWGEKSAVTRAKTPPKLAATPETLPNILDYIQPYLPRPNARGAYQCYCPFHDDDNPSAWVNPTQGRFGCNACFPGRWLDTVNIISMLTGESNKVLMRRYYPGGKDAVQMPCL